MWNRNGVLLISVRLQVLQSESYCSKYKVGICGKTYEVLLNYIDFPHLNLPEISFDGNDDEFDDKCIEDTQQQIESIAQLKS